MRFLVFHADAERRDGLKTLLRQINRHAGYNDAADQLQAEQLLARHPFDLVVIDWHDGQRLGDLEALCRLCAPTPVAMLIDNLPADSIQKFFTLGIRGVVPRAMAPHLIVRAFEMTLLGGYYIPPHAIDIVESVSTEHAKSIAQHQQLARQRRAPHVQLSERQKQVMRCVHMGCTNKMIARSLGISEGTVKVHLSSIFQQLGASNRAGAIALYNGWLSPQLEVLLSASEATPKPVYGAGGPLPLRLRTYPRKYPPYAANAAVMPSGTAEPSPRFGSPGTDN